MRGTLFYVRPPRKIPIARERRLAIGSGKRHSKVKNYERRSRDQRPPGMHKAEIYFRTASKDAFYIGAS